MLFSGEEELKGEKDKLFTCVFSSIHVLFIIWAIDELWNKKGRMEVWN